PPPAPVAVTVGAPLGADQTRRTVPTAGAAVSLVAASAITIQPSDQVPVHAVPLLLGQTATRAPRRMASLRATLGAETISFAFAAARLLRTMSKKPGTPTVSSTATTAIVVSSSSSVKPPAEVVCIACDS